ncbi:MAG: hypothetical protein ACRCSQ_02035 [Bacteroidales bacterium]
MKHPLLLLSFLFTLCACDEKVDSLIPRSRVEIQMNTRTTALDFIQQGYKIISSPTPEAPYIGFAGVLVVKGYTYESEAYAYDLACPVEISRSVLLKMKDDYNVVCPSCKSEFDVIRYGNPAPTSGPAKDLKLMLRRYNAHYSESSYLLTVYN